MDILKELFQIRDISYAAFQSRLMPTVSADTIIGVRTPLLRAFSKKIAGRPEAEVFLNSLPHMYYEENNLHAFLIEQEKDFDLAIARTEAFLPFIDNWATCDSFLPRVFKKQPQKLLPYIRKWAVSGEEFTVRYAVGLLMGLFSDELFSEEYLKLVSEIRSDKYYINMMLAWYFATLLTKQYHATLPYIENKVLPEFVHNKAIQKARESYRIPPEVKEYLNTLKIKPVKI